MTSEKFRKNEFAHHYQQLELNDRAGWKDARTNYRKLVHLWHPDKFATRPKEKALAQQRFIDLTKSYDALRSFYQKNERLPFQSQPVTSKGNDPSAGSVHHTDSLHMSEGAPDKDTDTSLDSSVLRRDPGRRQRLFGNRKTIRTIAWTVLGGSIMIGTAMFFLIVDRNANRAIAEKGRNVVKETPISEFMPSATEIRRSQTRGAFVKPTQ